MASSDRGPPDVPDIDRRFVRRHAVEVALLAALPLLALLGLLDTRAGEGRADLAGTVVEVEHPRVVRATRSATLAIRLAGSDPADGPAPATTLIVRVDPDYLAAFAVLRASPVPVAAGEWEVDAPAAGAEVVVELEATRWGRARGAVVVAAAGDSVSLPLRTFVLP